MGPLQWNTNRQCGTFVQARIFQYYMLRVKAKMMHLKLDSPIRYIFLSSLQTSSLQLYNYQWLVLFSEGIFWLIFSLFEQKMNVADLFFVSVWTEKWTSQICSSSLFEQKNERRRFVLRLCLNFSSSWNFLWFTTWIMEVNFLRRLLGCYLKREDRFSSRPIFCWETMCSITRPVFKLFQFQGWHFEK